MSEIESQSITRKFVVVSDSAPASPFEGQLWRDTSTDTLKQYNGTSWVSVQTSPDQKTTEIVNGELTVKYNSDFFIESGSGLELNSQTRRILGDFENGNIGDWTAFGSHYDGPRADNDQSSDPDVNGNYHLYDNPEGYSTGGIERNADLTGVDNLIFNVIDYPDNSSRDSDLYLRIDGSNERLIDKFGEITVDVSNYSGTHQIQFYMDNNYQYSQAYEIDFIRVESENYPAPTDLLNTLVADGAGGTNET